MSAFEVDKVHIDVLVSAAMQRGRYGETLRWYWGGAEGTLQNAEVTYETAGEVGAMLVAENRRSVNYRYSEDEIEEPYEFSEIAGTFDPVRMLGALACYEYQACESPDWRETQAHAFCHALRIRLIHELPGYRDAPWEVRDPAQVTIGAPVKVLRSRR